MFANNIKKITSILCITIMAIMLLGITGCGNNNKNAKEEIVTDPSLANKIFYKTEPTVYTNKDFGDIIVVDDKIIIFPLANDNIETIDLSIASNVIDKYTDLSLPESGWAEIRDKFGNKYDTGYAEPYFLNTFIPGTNTHSSIFFRCLKPGETVENPSMTIKMSIDTDPYGFITNVDFNGTNFEQS